ncbi:MAG: hypothetical protein A2Y25_06950 [Candidatus Melainabacteria bacterium GWF2_37_15]|nr:MAG: hypothetical protein A2Y25_06950 [Candidatus Melainabacteria bacterium GWF2_37_15]
MIRKVKLIKKSYWKNYILYAFLIVFLAEGINYFLGLKPVCQFLMKTVKTLDLDLLFYDFLYYTSPYLDLGKLAFLKNWLWMVPFAFFAFLTGILHVNIYEKRLDFKQVFLTSFLASFFKLLSYSVPFGIYPIFLYFLGFVMEYYKESLLIFPACFVGLFIGTEFFIIWIKNAGAEKMLSRYK